MADLVRKCWCEILLKEVYQENDNVNCYDVCKTDVHLVGAQILVNAINAVGCKGELCSGFVDHP